MHEPSPADAADDVDVLHDRERGIVAADLVVETPMDEETLVAVGQREKTDAKADEALDAPRLRSGIFEPEGEGGRLRRILGIGDEF